MNYDLIYIIESTRIYAQKDIAKDGDHDVHSVTPGWWDFK